MGQERRDKGSEGQQCLFMCSMAKCVVCVCVNACMCPSEVKLIFFHASKQTGSKKKNSNNA